MYIWYLVLLVLARPGQGHWWTLDGWCYLPPLLASQSHCTAGHWREQVCSTTRHLATAAVWEERRGEERRGGRKEGRGDITYGREIGIID